MPEQLDPIIDYFENNNIGVMHRRGRRRQRLPLELWNVNNRVEEDIPKNNHVEAYHKHLQAAILSFHPNIWSFLKVLKKEEALKRLEMIQMEAGEGPPPQKYDTVNVVAEYKQLLRTMTIEIPLAILEELPIINLSEISKLSLVA